MMRGTGKKKLSRLRRLVSCVKGRRKKDIDNCGETNSSCESHNKAQSSTPKGILATPSKTSRQSPPSTPATLPETSTPQKNGRSRDSAFVISYNDGSPSRVDLSRECATVDLSHFSQLQTDNFDQQPISNDHSCSPRREIVTALEIDQRQQAISTEDDIVSLHQEDSIDLDHVNRQLFQKLEESQKDVLASIIRPENSNELAAEIVHKEFSKIPDHPALGNLEKYRSGLVASSPVSRNASATAKKGGVNNSYIEEGNRSTDKGSVSEGLKSLWDETTKNLESMNKVLSSCALDWRQEARESFDEFAYTREDERNMQLNGVWLTVPDKHGEDISLLSYPRDIGSLSSRWTESQLDDVHVLRKTTATIAEEDEPIQENAKLRYSRWL